MCCSGSVNRSKRSNRNSHHSQQPRTAPVSVPQWKDWHDCHRGWGFTVGFRRRCRTEGTQFRRRNELGDGKNDVGRLSSLSCGARPCCSGTHLASTARPVARSGRPWRPVWGHCDGPRWRFPTLHFEAPRCGRQRVAGRFEVHLRG
jgi:hypothetical protein